MPRASNAKRQSGAAANANARDTRHENGLVGPAKRVSNKKSQSQLDASPAHHHSTSSAPSDGDASASPLPSPLPTFAIHGNGDTNGKIHPAAAMAADAVPRRGSLGAYSESSSGDSSASNPAGNGCVETQHRQIDVNATKNVDVHRDPGGPLEFAATVLRALPLYDTLAILILLMHVPPVALSGIYMAFTFLTFVPPVTTSSGMNINLAEIFDYNSTMPSLVTIGCMDILIMLVWLFLWPPIQVAILDLAKPVIAVTLGGGSSSREGTSSSVTTCFLLVIASHVLRGSRLHWSRATRLLPPNWRLASDNDDPLEAISQGFDKRGPHGWIKSILAIHILTQGIVRYIREWYLRREKSSGSSHSLSDPEAGKPADISGDAGLPTTTDSEAAALQHATTSSKKRRKQSTQVRLQQPLWAALASTKIVMVKEYELSHAASETAGSNATDIHNLGNAPFDSEAEQIWISYIGYDEICFNTSHFADIAPPTQNGHASRPAGVDTSKPFYVRVNNAYWQPTRIFRVQDEDGERASGHRWCGDVYGLRPLSKYVCEFVDTHTDRVIFSTSIRTTQAPTKDQEGVPASPAINGQQSLRPDSPATTLKSTISAQNERLSDERSKLKTLRKDWKSKVSALKKENEKLDNSIQSGGGNDDKLRQKIIQQETQKAQAEKEIAELDELLKEFEKAPEGLQERKKQAEKSWSAEKTVFDKASKEHKEFKAKLAAQIKAAQDEQAALQTKRNKMAARIAKVDTELMRITDANNRGLDEAERRRQGRAAWEAETKQIETNFRESIATMQANNATKQAQVNNLMSQLQTFHQQMNYSNNSLSFDGQHQHQHQHQQHQQHQQQQGFEAAASTNATSSGNSWNPNPAAAPHYPASMWPAAATTTTSNSTSGPGAAQPSLLPAPLMGAGHWLPSQAPVKSRGRSSSMLSDVSGFTQSSAGDDEYQSFHNTPAQAGAAGGSRPPPGLSWPSRGAHSGSGSSVRSGTGSGSRSGGSVRDPTSPV
ncbi:hypothetical protein VD0002_g8474 [Verticillium dahliae]|uniref:Ubiquitination network signaling protein n=4 Tax=Verticillium TaxID=1036719 RepID=G2X3W2_VERDV|nr:uncharacterized protein VDAG_04699 [Verticillium dahliae VdLs.17]KAH6691847.1 hypothetical protein EV126DRAFT_453867 [Verticillium dahliae]EGY23261.1 hypothetical protein VDAG_04699 [Verticillium dahliae VdLs.17]PNH27441.1 hypothetical protein BJF96_g9231 [Verticillium dahliae]PNH45460.1 hypothetical protein VD0003_g9215 [Verticillium dahliae]PNH59067.1 hypothetical protein VD0002_g8474 [Verticillium dahliae]